MKKIVKSFILILLLGTFSVQATLSAFTSKGKVLGNTFTIGHADLAMLKNLGQPPTPDNLAESIPGFTFTDITSGWKRRVGVKVLNKGSLPLNTLLAVNSLSTPGEGQPNLNQVLKVMTFRWEDNGDGIIQESEYRSANEIKTFQYWLGSPYTMGILPPNQVLSLILEFWVDDLGAEYEGTSTSLDFVFDATAIN